MKKLIVLSFVLIFFTGCSAEAKKERIICESVFDQEVYRIESSYEFIHDGDKVTQYREEAFYYFPDADVKETTVPLLESMNSEFKNYYDGIDGINYEYSVSEDKEYSFEMSLTIDLSKVDADELFENNPGTESSVKDWLSYLQSLYTEATKCTIES